ncbi:chorismate mutase [Sulfurimonas aquatica]|uniref:chorismate mutase n=1 Tax=Sulfurimonas aquatica TaxID=2672570 RepID=A0A975GBM1_9BACT|nr:chorismate mutase [Sulfurimonas aquatica]QSZ40821.1 chorismate mutase [Sulfurimonas aquatica]
MSNLKKCNTLEEVRSEIDKIDDQLVETISDRSHLIRQAASFKNSVDEVKAQDRIDFIIQRVRHKGIQLGINPNMLAEIFTIMIDEMVEMEISEFRNSDVF